MAPDLRERLKRARAVDGLVRLRDLRLWALDETCATGSVIAVVSVDADAQQVTERIRAALETEAVRQLTIAVEREMDDDVDEFGRWAAI